MLLSQRAALMGQHTTYQLEPIELCRAGVNGSMPKIDISHCPIRDKSSKPAGSTADGDV